MNPAVKYRWLGSLPGGMAAIGGGPSGYVVSQLRRSVQLADSVAVRAPWPAGKIVGSFPSPAHVRLLGTSYAAAICLGAVGSRVVITNSQNAAISWIGLRLWGGRRRAGTIR